MLRPLKSPPPSRGRVREGGTRVAGVDGCKSGWVVCYRDDERIVFDRVDDFAEIVRNGKFARVVVDMPIGFEDAARKGGRECEKLARAILRTAGRSSCVFNSPCRGALYANSPVSAKKINMMAEGLSLTDQSLNLFKKMRQVDRAIRRQEAIDSVFESHPEIAFADMNDGFPVASKKKSAAGRSQRLALLRRHGIEIPTSEFGRFKRKDVALDDIIDAAACLWVAEAGRKNFDKFMPMPSLPPVDRHNIKMAIWRRAPVPPP